MAAAAAGLTVKRDAERCTWRRQSVGPAQATLHWRGAGLVVPPAEAPEPVQLRPLCATVADGMQQGNELAVTLAVHLRGSSTEGGAQPETSDTAATDSGATRALLEAGSMGLEAKKHQC